MKQELFGGGVLGGLRDLLDMKNKLANLGIDFRQAADLMPAIDQLLAAQSSEQKLEAFQVLLREFSQVTTKFDGDDKVSALVDELMQSDTLKAWVLNLLDKATTSAQEPGFRLGLEQPTDVVVQELNLRGIDFEKLQQLVLFIAQLVALYKGA